MDCDPETAKQTRINKEENIGRFIALYEGHFQGGGPEEGGWTNTIWQEVTRLPYTKSNVNELQQKLDLCAKYNKPYFYKLMSETKPYQWNTKPSDVHTHYE